MTEKDQIENLSWQLERESGLRAQMTERMETAEKVAAGLREELRVASHNLRELACRDNSVVTALRAKSKQQLADSLTAENATLERLEKAERELKEARALNQTVFDKCNSLQNQRDTAQADLVAHKAELIEVRAILNAPDTESTIDAASRVRAKAETCTQ